MELGRRGAWVDREIRKVREFREFKEVRENSYSARLNSSHGAEGHMASKK